MLVGDVIRVWDRRTHPPKFKRHICICPERRMFLRINSKPLFPPHMAIAAAEGGYLDHDSYIELQQLVRHFEIEVDQADHLGRITPTQKRRLEISVAACNALAPDVKDFILARLAAY